MDYALVGYPLSNSFREQFERATFSSPVYLGIPELRRMNPLGLLTMLLGLKADRLFIALEGDSSRAYLPLFYCLAGVSRAREIQLVHPDLRRERITRTQTIGSLAAVLGASAGARRHVRACGQQLQELIEAPRIAADANDSRRVLYLKTNLWAGVKAGGSVGHVAGVVNALAEQGYQVDFAGIEPPLMADGNVVFHHVEPPQAYAFPYETNLWRFQRAFVEQVKPLEALHACSFIYQRMSIGNYAGVVLSRHSGRPLVLEYNGSEVWAAANWGKRLRNHDLAEQAEEVSLRHAHLVVTVSDVLKDELIERGVEPERIVAHPNGIDPSVFDPARFSAADRAALRKQWGIAADAIVAGFVGTFGQWHGAEVLAEAIRRFACEQPDWLRQHKVHFLFVGDGLMMPSVKTALTDPRCRPFYTLTGLVSQADAPRYMAAADLLVSPHVANQDQTRFFGSPTKLFEYMAMGKAIAASDLEQIGQVLCGSLRADCLPEGPPDDTAARAVLSRPGDFDELKAALRFLVERPDWREALGRQARQTALDRYTWDRHVSAILDGLATATHEPVLSG